MATALNSSAPFEAAPGSSILALISSIFSFRKPVTTWDYVFIGM